MAGLAECDYTVRQAAYDLRKLRAKELVTKNGRSRRYTVPADAARTMTALLVLREHVLGPIMAGCRVPMRGRRPNTWTAVDQHYEAIRRDMIALFRRDRPYPGSACRGIDNILSIIGAKRLDPVWSRLVSFGRNNPPIGDWTGIAGRAKTIGMGLVPLHILYCAYFTALATGPVAIGRRQFRARHSLHGPGENSE